MRRACLAGTPTPPTPRPPDAQGLRLLDELNACDLLVLDDPLPHHPDQQRNRGPADRHPRRAMRRAIREIGRRTDVVSDTPAAREGHGTTAVTSQLDPQDQSILNRIVSKAETRQLHRPNMRRHPRAAAAPAQD